ncbi:MAG: DUF2214 family protein [Cyclobacteriaceae bacterium]
MDLGWLLAALHLTTLGIGFGFCWMRGYALRNLISTSGLKPVFFADNLYGIAALLWITTGLLRAFGGYAKGSEYYLSSAAFWVKMGLFGMVFLLELIPMVTLIKWRIQEKKGQAIDLSSAHRLGAVSYIEVLLLAAIVFVAAGMARGMWY